jgi:hypothetical protein
LLHCCCLSFLNPKGSSGLKNTNIWMR